MGLSYLTKNTLTATVSNIYAFSMVPCSAGTYISNDVIAKLASKPDGQCVWMVWVGNIWYICQPRGRYIDRWIRTNNMLSHGYIMIDFLTDFHGNMAPISRDINWVIEQFNSIVNICPELPLSMRQYFTISTDAERYSYNALYPTDGIIAIKNGSTEILKNWHIRHIHQKMMRGVLPYYGVIIYVKILYIQLYLVMPINLLL